MTTEALGFRPGAVLATSFTGTVTERRGLPLERIATPDRLLLWLARRGLEVAACSLDELRRAHLLREAIHRAATAAATGSPVPESSVDVINAASRHGSSAPVLAPDGTMRWELGSPAPVDAALSVIAADAVALLAGERAGSFALCASPTCRAAFFDTSRSRTRRWCDMNTCGNREKKSKLKARTGQVPL